MSGLGSFFNSCKNSNRETDTFYSLNQYKFLITHSCTPTTLISTQNNVIVMVIPQTASLSLQHYLYCVSPDDLLLQKSDFSVEV